MNIGKYILSKLIITKDDNADVSFGKVMLGSLILVYLGGGICALICWAVISLYKLFI